jgi:acetyl-CoA carboxylase biotin carboxylase subunit
MNTRLQVEHPITERTTGIDIVKEQINIAAGHPLSFSQDEVHQFGHSIECRISAEDPFNNFMPSPGVIRHISEPNGLGIRTDGYVYEGFEIPMHYDPMISKVIAWGRTREEAIERMRRALFEYKITGVKTSTKFLERIMMHSEFRKGIYDTHFIEKNSEELLTPCLNEKTVSVDMAIIAAYIDYTNKLEKASMGDYELSRNGEKYKWKDYGLMKALQRI